MTTTTTTDTRKATCWLNYRGEVTFQPHKPFGPNTMGETLWMVSVEYNSATDRSRVGFSLVAPTPEVQA